MDTSHVVLLVAVMAQLILGILGYKLAVRGIDAAVEVAREAIEDIVAVNDLDAARYIDVKRERRHEQAVKGTERPMERRRLD